MSLPHPVNVLLVGRPNDPRIEQVRAVDPDRLRVTAVSGAAIAGAGEDLWPAWGGDSQPTPVDEHLLREAHVILLDLPYPTKLASKTRDLLWVHHPNAGTSNLWNSDFWGGDVPVTTSRGANAALPIAETTIAAALMFARGLHVAARGWAARSAFAGNSLVAGKTMGIVGLGGIGSEVARLARGLGMRVVASRRSARERTSNTDGVDELLPPGDLHDLLAQSDFVAVCVMLTKETDGMFDAAAFAAMKPGAVLLNVSRGEVIDEPALVTALRDGKLSGVYLDVYAGELSGSPPPPELLEDDRVVITPHTSGATDVSGHSGFTLFLENLRRFLDGRDLLNVIDWDRGY